MALFLTALGLAMVLEGLPYFAFPERVKNWLSRLSTMAPGQLRAMGLGLMAAGVVVIYLGRRLLGP